MLGKYWKNILGEFSYRSLEINITTVVSIREVVLICPEKNYSLSFIFLFI